MASHSLLPRIDSSSPLYNDESLRNKLWHIHGLLLCGAFLALYPLGVLAIRSGSPLSFRYHWLLQTSASILALSGVLVGFVTSSAIVLWHQWLGIALGLGVILQSLAGWKHHVDFLRIRRRTWISYLHLWLGRTSMGLAWLNIFWGLQLRGYNWFVVGCALAAMVGMAAAWIAWSWGWLRWGANRGRQSAKHHVVPSAEEEQGREGLMRGDDRDFALDSLHDDEDEDEDGEQTEIAKNKGDKA